MVLSSAQAEYLASQTSLFWWLKPEEILAAPRRALAGIMARGDMANWRKMENLFSRETIIDALENASCGDFSGWSWNFWRKRYYLPEKPLPARLPGMPPPSGLPWHEELRRRGHNNANTVDTDRRKYLDWVKKIQKSFLASNIAEQSGKGRTLQTTLKSLPEPQRLLWPELEKVSQLGYVLYGGTSLAMRFAHRKSVDFDFFATREIESEQLVGLFPWLADCKVTQYTNNTYSYETNYGANISFFSGIPMGRLINPDIDEDTGIQIASAEDVFALKLSTIHQRITLKDYMDIADLLRRGFSLETGMLGAQILVQGMLPCAITIRTLLWFEAQELTGLSQRDKDEITNACVNLDFSRLDGECRLALAGETLFDENLYAEWQRQKNGLKPR